MFFKPAPMNLKKHVPNFLTLLNLLCGCIAVVFAANGVFDWAFYFVCLGIFFDFFDGFLARKFGVAGPLGVQLDSLADMVTSGVAPGYVMYSMLGVAIHENFSVYGAFFGFVITLGACYRLANFNIDTRQSDSFIGLPTPANALFIMSLPLVVHDYQNALWVDNVLNQWVLIGITILSTYVMNAEIPLFSLKIKNFSFAKYKLQVGFLIAAVAMIIVLKILAVPLIILLYVLLSVFNNMSAKKEL